MAVSSVDMQVSRMHSDVAALTASYHPPRHAGDLTTMMEPFTKSKYSSSGGNQILTTFPYVTKSPVCCLIKVAMCRGSAYLYTKEHVNG